MGERLGLYFPYVLAVLLPPVGILLGAIAMQRDREEGVRLIATALLAMVVWVLIFTV